MVQYSSTGGQRRSGPLAVMLRGLEVGGCGGEGPGLSSRVSFLLVKHLVKAISCWVCPFDFSWCCTGDLRILDAFMLN